MSKAVAEKMGVRPNARIYLHGVPSDVLLSMQLPTVHVSDTLCGQFEYILAFMTTQGQVKDQLPPLRDALAASGSLWLSWPKAGQLGTDISLAGVIRIGYDAGLVESKCISVDAVWSALKFTHPIRGKTYRNSYGQLPNA